MHRAAESPATPVRGPARCLQVTGSDRSLRPAERADRNTQTWQKHPLAPAPACSEAREQRHDPEDKPCPPGLTPASAGCFILAKLLGSPGAPVSWQLGSAPRLHGRVKPSSPSHLPPSPFPKAMAATEVLMAGALSPRTSQDGVWPRCPYITSPLRTAQGIPFFFFFPPFSNSVLFLGILITHPALRKAGTREPAPFFQLCSLVT